MQVVNMLEARSQLFRLVKAALEGEEIVIARNGVPMGKLVTVEPRKSAPTFGAWRDLPPADPDWDSPEFNREIAEEFFGSGL